MKIKDLVEQYIEYSINLGHKFRTHSIYLRAFTKHIGNETDISDISSTMCRSFLFKNQEVITNTWFCRYTALNGLFKWCVSRNYIKDNPLPLEKPAKPDYCKPYIYSKEELKAIFQSCLTYQKGWSKNYPECSKLILMLTYMLGLRIRETMNLHISDINLEEGYLVIQESKFYKSRILPFNQQVKKIIECFLAWRKTVKMDDSPSAFLFLTSQNTPMVKHSLNHYFLQILKEAQITRNDNYNGHPRIHDLRHTFAVHRLISWYKNDDNVQVMLPYLSTYLGHDNLSHTMVYLSMTDELLFEANIKFENFANNKSI